MVPAAEFFNRSIDSVMLYMHGYKNKTYKREDIYTSFTCKSWGPPVGHQLLCGTAISVHPERGFMLYFVFLSHSITAVKCVSQRSNSIIRRQKIWLLALGNLSFPGKLHLSSVKTQVPQSRKGWAKSLHFIGSLFNSPVIHWRVMTRHKKALRSCTYLQACKYFCWPYGIACMPNSKYMLKHLAEAESRLVDTPPGPWIWKSDLK